MPSSPSERTLQPSSRDADAVVADVQHQPATPRRADRRRDAAGLRMTNRVGQRLFEHAERRGRDLGIDGVVDARRDRHRDAGDRRHAPRFIFDGAAKVAMIEARRTEPGGNPPHHRDAEIDLADGRLQAIDDVAGRLQLAEPADGRHEIELDAGEQLAELVVQLARDARPLFFAHLLETLRQRGIEIDGG